MASCPPSVRRLDVYKRQVPLRLERNGQVFQTELGGVPLFDLERPDLCLNVSELLEMIQ